MLSLNLKMGFSTTNTDTQDDGELRIVMGKQV